MITIKELKERVRHPYAMPGGYEIVFIANDGELLCHKCVRENWKEVLWSTKNRVNDGWNIVATSYEAVSPEDTRESAGEDYIHSCAHCYKEIGELGA